MTNASCSWCLSNQWSPTEHLLSKYLVCYYHMSLGLHSKITKSRKHRVTIPCKRSFDFTWNPPDFMKSVWNLADFMVKSGGFQVKSAGFQIMSFCVMIKYRSFDFRKTNQDSCRQEQATSSDWRQYLIECYFSSVKGAKTLKPPVIFRITQKQHHWVTHPLKLELMVPAIWWSCFSFTPWQTPGSR